MSRSFFSVVIPVRDGGEGFVRCLGGLAASRCRDFELIVVDDGSRDGSAAAARRAGAEMLSTGGDGGPAAARNLGARRAAGEWLLFLDADCEVAPGTLGRMRDALEASPGLAAAFGSYDDAPAAPGLVSRYRNLLHHWVHQRGAGEVTSFWAGCGAVRRETFLAAGGFDAARYPRPSIEDVELGRRLAASGHRIALLPAVQVTHHKRWSFREMVRVDVRDRAVPWVELARERGGLGGELNVDLVGRASGVAAVSLAAALAALHFAPRPAVGVAGAAASFLIAAHAGFYRLLLRRGGVRLLAAGIPLHWLHFLYSSGAYAWATLRPAARGSRGAAARGRAAATPSCAGSPGPPPARPSLEGERT